MASFNNHTKIIAVTVPTKQHDGGSNSDRANRVIHAAAAPQQKPDAFTKYSSNLIRMKELLLLSDNNEEGKEDDLDYLASLNYALRYASISDRGQQIDRNNHGDAACKDEREITRAPSHRTAKAASLSARQEYHSSFIQVYSCTIS